MTKTTLRSPAQKSPSEIRVQGDAAFVLLKAGFEAVIDAADVPLVEGRRWYLLSLKHGHAYAACWVKGKTVLMHRLLLDSLPGTFVDHADGDGLNNRRSNIRVATSSQNMANRVHDRRNKLGIRGVHRAKGKFKACIQKDGQTIHLGSFATAEEAAAAYKGAARVLWKEFSPV